MPWKIRNVTSADLDRVLELNESVVPAVNSLTADDVAWFAEHANHFRVAERDGNTDAFMIGLRPGLKYDSLNYRWFCERYTDFGYVDRVAVDQALRRSGIASTLYDDFRTSLSPEVSVMTCEVNIEPPNDASMRFHERLGFRRVGTQRTENGNKRVALMERPL